MPRKPVWTFSEYIKNCVLLDGQCSDSCGAKKTRLMDSKERKSNGLQGASFLHEGAWLFKIYFFQCPEMTLPWCDNRIGLRHRKTTLNWISYRPAARSMDYTFHVGICAADTLPCPELLRDLSGNFKYGGKWWKSQKLDCAIPISVRPCTQKGCSAIRRFGCTNTGEN